MTDKIIRSESLYVSYDVRKALQIIAQAKGEETADAMANTILIEWITNNHEDVVIHLHQRKETDKAFRDALKAKLNPDPLAAKP